MSAPDLERALAFVRGIDERASTRVETLPFGVAYLHPELPRVWSRNFVWVDDGVAARELETLLEEVDRVHAAAGLDHRRLVFTDGGGAAAAPLLAAREWRVQRTCVMVHRGPAPDEPQAVEVEAELLRPASEAAARDHPDVEGTRDVGQLQRAYQVVAEATHERCFAAAAGSSVAAFCRLYSDGETAQIEDVSTLTAHRNRGYGAAVVCAALAAAKRSHGMTFLLADDEDWPKGWYRRLGFQPVGLMREAVLVTSKT